MISRTRFLSRALALGLIFVFVASCTDRPSPLAVAPAPAPEASLIGDLLRMTGLLSCSPLPYASATKTIGPNGGVIQVGPHYLVVPANALASNVTITAEAPSATVNSVRLQPEGLNFDRPAYLTMSYANCNLLGKLLPKRIAYTTDDYQILSYLVSLDLLSLKRVTGRLDHFSTYAVAW